MTREEARDEIKNLLDYIRGEKELKPIKTREDAEAEERKGVEALEMAIKALEQEPKIGHWIKSRDRYGNNHFTCPFCGNDIATKCAGTLYDNYCSNCGARLESENIPIDLYKVNLDLSNLPQMEKSLIDNEIERQYKRRAAELKAEREKKGMKPLNCCKSCEGLNENGTFRNKLKCLFSCDKYAFEETKRLYDELKVNKGCSTCKYCEHVHDYPGFVTAEESICRVGLKCDTVYFTVKNCPKWVGQLESEET